MRSEDLFGGISQISDKWIAEADDAEALLAAVKEKKKRPAGYLPGVAVWVISSGCTWRHSPCTAR